MLSGRYVWAIEVGPDDAASRPQSSAPCQSIVLAPLVFSNLGTFLKAPEVIEVGPAKRGQ